MASFDIAYTKYIKPAEGGYANVTGDKGGETYGGIARNYWPAWSGWPLIDKKKAAAGGTIKRGTIFPDLDASTRQFYLDWWNKGMFSQIASQDIANLLFDYNVNSGATAIKAIQRLVGSGPDGVMGPATVSAINSANTTKLYNDLLAQRKGLYQSIVANDPSQQVFWNGWMNRLKSFPELVTPRNTAVVLLFIGLAVWGGYHFFGSKSKTKAAPASMS